jgi:hypothetical protein
MVSATSPPYREIRAVFDAQTVRVYQAYSHEIAETALRHGRFVSPPFKLTRMTWIKPSFLWMMYRSQWGRRDSGQRRVLGIDITRQGFDWALAHSCLSHYESILPYTEEEWHRMNREAPVKIQWDPERDLALRPLSYRSIQIGIGPAAANRYVHEWTVRIADLSGLATEIATKVESGDITSALGLLPAERSYPLDVRLAKHIGASLERPE